MRTNGSRGNHSDILRVTPSVSVLLDQVKVLQEVARTGTVQELVKHLDRAGWIPPVIAESTPEPWVGTAEVAKLLGQTPEWVRTRADLLPHIRISRQYRFRISEVERWYKQWIAGDRMDFAMHQLGMKPATPLYEDNDLFRELLASQNEGGDHPSDISYSATQCNNRVGP